MAVVAAAATTYVMIKGIPDSNQTFREITFDIVSKQVENDIQPRVFFEDFAGWVIYARDAAAARRRLEGRPRGHTTKPDAPPDVFLASRGRVILNREQRRVDLVLTERGTVLERASRARRRRISVSSRPDARPQPGYGLREAGAAARHHRKDDRRAADGRARQSSGTTRRSHRTRRSSRSSRSSRSRWPASSSRSSDSRSA